MSTAPSPRAEPRNVEQQHTLAKDLLRAARAGEAPAIARLRALFPTQAEFALADAQLAVARDSGFESWPKLIEHAERHERTRFHEALDRRDAAEVRRLLKNSTYLRSQINAPVAEFGGRAAHEAANDPALLDVLVEFGADLNLGSDWSNGPFTPLDRAKTESAVRHLLARGATLTPHVAARMGWVDELRAMLDADPSLVHARGGDGKTPLHEAATTQVVDLLLDRGADINARCIDHRSTAAQYLLVERPEVCRHLIARGAEADLFQAAHLGDRALAQRLIDADPNSPAARVNADGYAPVPPFSIYCWTLGWNLSPAEVARAAGHDEVAALIDARSDTKTRLLAAAWAADAPTVKQIIAADPGLIGRLTTKDHSLLASAVHHVRNDAARLMLSLGFDVMARANDRGTALHQACWTGNAEIVELLIAHGGSDLDDRGDDHKSPPIGWAAFGSVHCGHGPRQYETVIRRLAAAGASLQIIGNLNGTPLVQMAKGNERIQAVLRELGARD